MVGGHTGFAMELTSEQRATLAGDEGELMAKALRTLVRYGEAFGARRLVPITSAHLAGSFRIFFFHGYYALLTQMVEAGLRVKVPTTLNPRPGVEVAPQNRLVFRGQKWHEEQLIRLGVTPNFSCVCYVSDNVPSFGDILGWAESSAIIYANSVIGARSNRNGIMVDVCQAVTGLAPEFGFLLDENRKGQVRVHLDVERMDANALGHLLGEICVDRTPVLDHYPFDRIELKNMGAAMASSGGVTLFHVLGLTPEAPNESAVFDRDPEETVTITQRDLDGLRDRRELQRNARMIAFGCPQMTFEEAMEIGRHFKGKRVQKPTSFHVMPTAFERFRETETYRDVLRAGVEVHQHCPLAGFSLRIGIRGTNVLTNSGKLKYYLAGTQYGDLHDVLRECGVLD